MLKGNPNEISLVIKPWYSYMGGIYTGALPPFYDKARWPELAEAERSYPLFRNEIERLISASVPSLKPYFNAELTNGKWEVADFYFWGKANESNCAACPELARFLKNIPGLISATASKLSPHTTILPHVGDTNLIARCHLGLLIPAKLPDCGMEVNGEQRSWDEGKWLIFCDAYKHSAWNRTDAPRFVLILDLILPEFLARKQEIIRNVRSLLRLQKSEQNMPWIKKLPGPARGMLRHFFKFIGR